MSEDKVGLLLSDDLLFASKITATATAHGFTMRVAREAKKLLQWTHEKPPCCVLLDLQNPGLPLEETVAALKALEPSPRLIAYGSHVDAESLKRARAAGCDLAWPRSKFSTELETALPGWFAE